MSMYDLATERAPSLSGAVPQEPTMRRLRSLDIFRGITISAMLLVNNPGASKSEDIYWPLRHATWDGLTPTDLIFPFFLFIVGVAIPFSFASRRSKPGASEGALFWRIVRRSIILFGLGLAVAAIPTRLKTAEHTDANGRIVKADPGNGILNRETLRIPGVLQRIAVCYLVTGLIAMIGSASLELLAAIALCVLYSWLMFHNAAPHYDAGDLSRRGNYAFYLDTQVFHKHVYLIDSATGEPLGDPEGVLSTLPAIATSLLGVLAGRCLMRRRPEGEKSAALMAMGVALGIVGYVLMYRLMPLNKQIWTPSFAVLTAALGMLGLGLIHYIADVRGDWR